MRVLKGSSSDGAKTLGSNATLPRKHGTQGKTVVSEYNSVSPIALLTGKPG